MEALSLFWWGSGVPLCCLLVCVCACAMLQIIHKNIHTTYGVILYELISYWSDISIWNNDVFLSFSFINILWLRIMLLCVWSFTDCLLMLMQQSGIRGRFLWSNAAAQMNHWATILFVVFLSDLEQFDYSSWKQFCTLEKPQQINFERQSGNLVVVDLHLTLCSAPCFFLSGLSTVLFRTGAIQF